MPARHVAAIKQRDPTISTVFYMNSVLDWYFYRMHYQYLQHPDWWLRCSKGPDGQRSQAAGCTSIGAPLLPPRRPPFQPPG
eukprot:2720_1